MSKMFSSKETRRIAKIIVAKTINKDGWSVDSSRHLYSPPVDFNGQLIRICYIPTVSRQYIFPRVHLESVVVSQPDEELFSNPERRPKPVILRDTVISYAFWFFQKTLKDMAESIIIAGNDGIKIKRNIITAIQTPELIGALSHPEDHIALEDKSNED